MKKLIIAAMACCSLSAHAQVQESRNFVYFFTDSVQYANRIRLRPDALNSMQLRVDGKKIPLASVKFFNNEEGFFANTRKLSRHTDFYMAERIVEGKINLFQQIDDDDAWMQGSGRFRNRSHNPVEVRMYYNKAYANLKKVNYINMKKDMADDQISIDMLAGYRKSMVTTRVLYLAAGASAIAGLISFVATGNKSLHEAEGTSLSDRNSPGSIKQANFTAVFVLAGLSTGFAIGGYCTSLSGARKLDRVVDTYNR